jgi:hypothetical protein
LNINRLLYIKKQHKPLALLRRIVGRPESQ